MSDCKIHGTIEIIEDECLFCKYDFTSKLEENLKRVIKALEWEQGKNYSPITNMILSYLYDIQNDTVPTNLITDTV